MKTRTLGGCRRLVAGGQVLYVGCAQWPSSVCGLCGRFGALLSMYGVRFAEASDTGSTGFFVDLGEIERFLLRVGTPDSPLVAKFLL